LIICTITNCPLVTGEIVPVSFIDSPDEYEDLSVLNVTSAAKAGGIANPAHTRITISGICFNFIILLKILIN
jgi:hypothetical protein